MNLAALWKSPVIYLCENNMYGEYTHMERVTAGPDIIARGNSFGIPSYSVDGQDVLAVFKSVTEAVDRGRAGDGPTFLVCNTYRYRGHHVGDQLRAYRSRDEEKEWQEQRDPITNYADWLVSQGKATRNELELADAKVQSEIEDGVAFAKASPHPSAEEVNHHVYA